jgi:hypothetical protein
MSLALPHVITCQALCHALPDVLGLPESERSHAMDVAAVVIRQVDEACEAIFSEVPELLQEARRDAQEALALLHLQCCWTLIWEGEHPLIVPETPEGVPARGDTGTLLLALPGTVVLPGTPVGWWSNRAEPMLGHFVPGLQARPLLEGVQLWRVVDGNGQWCQDVVLELEDDPPTQATPLLVPRLVGGLRLEMPMPREGWIGSAEVPKNPVTVLWESKTGQCSVDDSR